MPARRLPAISHLETWLSETSRGFVPFVDLESWLTDPEMLQLVRDFQLGALAGQIREHRAGDPPAPRVSLLIDLVRARRDMSGVILYRGLSASVPVDDTSNYREASLSSWTPYPSIALRLAMLQGTDNLHLIRHRIGPDHASMSLDDWEYEVLRPPFAARVSRYINDWINFDGVPIRLAVVDLGNDARDE